MTWEASVVAKPLSDIHATSLELYAVNALQDGGRFAVAVSREDDLIEKGNVVAAKFTDVIMVFDVTPLGQVSVNGQPIPMGLSNIQVEAATVFGAGPQSNLTRDQLEKAFDVGVVGIQILAQSDKTLVEGVNVTRITIAERIFELNGVEVVQGNQEDNVVGQVVDVYPDGKMVRQKACPMAVGEKLMPSPKGKHMKGCLRRISRWFNALPMSSKAVFVGISGIAMLLFYASVVRLVYVLVRGPREEVDFEGKAEQEEVLVIGEYEKGAVVYEAAAVEEDLPAYKPGYSAVATSEDKQ
ncbi:hypothetical protein HDU97_007027 [Phlyctochytrium planicorne]|nr:hypothetical protein HDU97_007027 [Phlyctochytrium planicorne]